MGTDMGRYLILRAKKHNWSLIGPGSWTGVTWSVYSDGTYKIESEFNPVLTKEQIDECRNADRFKELTKKNKHTKTGRMNEEKFSELIDRMNRKPWKDPLIISGGCDGVAWEIKQYSADGKVIDTSGRIDYIYGQEVLESIISCLPRDGKSYGANAYVNVGRLDPNPKYVEGEESREGVTRLIVCGGKDFQDRDFFREKLDALINRYEYVELVSGHAKGADTLAEIYAYNNRIPIKIFRAYWELYGKAAGPKRNREMLEYARETDCAVIAFWNGKSRGTGNMLKQAKAAGIECHICLYDDNVV